MPTLTLLLGAPGAGKTTKAAAMVKETPGTVIVGRDPIRQMLYGGHYTYSPESEALVKACQYQAIAAAFAAGLNVISDDAGNLKEGTRRDLYAAFGARHEIIEDRSLMEVPQALCIARDRQRPNSVGEAVIRKFFDMHYPNTGAGGRPFDPELPRAIVVDVDGCLSRMTPGRDPLDYLAAGTDEPYGPVIGIVLQARSRGDLIFVVTGRETRGLAVLHNWLRDAGVSPDKILMRPDGDRTPAHVLKAAIMTDLIEEFNIGLAIDDDPNVIAAYSALGVRTMQIGGVNWDVEPKG